MVLTSRSGGVLGREVESIKGNSQHGFDHSEWQGRGRLRHSSFRIDTGTTRSPGGVRSGHCEHPNGDIVVGTCVDRLI